MSPAMLRKLSSTAFEERTGCTIEDTVVDFENYNTALANSIAANDPYDIGYIYGSFFPTQIIAGMYQPVNSYMTEDNLLDSSSAETIANGGFDIGKMTITAGTATTTACPLIGM